jgi:hypothetical protein
MIGSIELPLTMPCRMTNPRRISNNAARIMLKLKITSSVAELYKNHRRGG